MRGLQASWEPFAVPPQAIGAAIAAWPTPLTLTGIAG
jgi:hypothetical protein